METIALVEKALLGGRGHPQGAAFAAWNAWWSVREFAELNVRTSGAPKRLGPLPDNRQIGEAKELPGQLPMSGQVSRYSGVEITRGISYLGDRLAKATTISQRRGWQWFVHRTRVAAPNVVFVAKRNACSMTPASRFG